MKINYNDWFYKFHQYLTGNRDGVETFNDTKWANVQEQLQRLIDLESSLINEQPYVVVGNDYGFDRLLDLMYKSSYTFNDVNDALIETYKQSLRNSMSRMVVNTRAIVYHNKNMSTAYSEGKYYVIDIPYNQLRFGGERDEFIRQRFQSLNDTSNKLFLNIDEFSLSEYTKILKCAFIVSINGMICNDVKIGFNDYGLKFKIGWVGSEDPELIIYKLDDCLVFKQNLTIGQLRFFMDEDGYIDLPNAFLGERKDEAQLAAWRNCIIDIYGTKYPSVNVIPNFGSINDSGRLTISNIQQASLDRLDSNHITELSMIVYVPKFFNEIPEIYPAANYMNMVKSSVVYTDLGNKVKNKDGMNVLTQDAYVETYVDVCTPPICIDREYDMGFDVIVNSIYCYDIMQAQFQNIAKLTLYITNPAVYMVYYSQFESTVKPVVETIYDTINPYFKSYLNAAVITSAIDENRVSKFTEFMSALSKFRNITEEEFINSGWRRFVVDEFYTSLYLKFVEYVCDPLYNNDVFKNFRGIHDIPRKFYEIQETSYHYNRPVSEQCFVTLKYSRDYECWLFASPKIKHFQGIGNSFYINEDLKGNELFKFFVLYTDTESPSETVVDDEFSERTVLDFDLFEQETKHHLGFIRYWNVENKLMKMSKIMFNKYDDETVVATLSKILSRKVNGYELVNQYDSEMNYEPSNATTDNLKEYTTSSERAPFVLNFLFYTLSLMTGNEDKLQTFFYQSLVDSKFNPRYIDYNISRVVDDKLKMVMNYGIVMYNSESSLTSDSNPLMDGKCHVYYGNPYVFVNDTIRSIGDDTYAYSFARRSTHDYPARCWLVNDGELNTSYWADPSTQGGDGDAANNYSNYAYVNVTRLITKFLCSIRDCIGYVYTNYKHPVNIKLFLISQKEAIAKSRDNIKEYYDKYIVSTHEEQTFEPIMRYIITNYPFDEIIDNLIDKITSVTKSDNFYGGINSKQKEVRQQSNWFAGAIRVTYLNKGYHENTKPRVRKLYMHFKELNGLLNNYQYKTWINPDNYDSLFFTDDLYRADSEFNTENQLPEFNTLRNRANAYDTVSESMVDSVLPEFETAFNSLMEDSLEYVTYLENYCADVIQNRIFDLYVLNDVIGVDYSQHMTQKPAYIVWTCNRDDHFNYPNSSIRPITETNVLFVPTVEKISDNDYYISSIRKPCEYAFFDGTPIANCSLKVYSDSGVLIKTITGVTMTFSKVSNCGNHLNNVITIPNVGDTNVMFDNKHENFTVDSNGMIINTKQNVTNYEMLIGNNFLTVDHTDELVLDMKTMLQGSQDQVYINNQKLNIMLLRDYNSKSSPRVFFKPCQVLHQPVDDTDKNKLVSVGGRYVVGQRIYLYPKNYPYYIFPCIITAIDHSRAHGFVEAKVDNRHTKWLEIKDNELMVDFLKNPIECEVIPDNISNFLDEFSNEDYVSYYNPMFDTDLEYSDEDFPEMLSVPGDPIFVQTNAEYIYSRLNWMLPDEIDKSKRFIDDQHKQWRFLYIGWDSPQDTIGLTSKRMFVHCINRDMSKLSTSEIYPVLRDEPNDHSVWRAEKSEFQRMIDVYTVKRNDLMVELGETQMAYNKATLEYKRDEYSRKMSDLRYKITSVVDNINRLQSYIDEPEHQTTWYNVDSYETAMKYIQNGRAKQLVTYSPNIRDIVWNEDVQVLLYDWDNKQWIDKSLYSVEAITIENNSDFEVYDEYTTGDVLRTLVINCDDENFPKTKKVLIYIAYYSSDVFSTIPNNDATCNVRFKPILSVSQDNYTEDVDDLTEKLKLRKHIDGSEDYVFESSDYVKPDDFSKEAYHIHRVNHSGKHPYVPSMRYCDLSITQNGVTKDYTQLELWVRNPFKGSTTNVQIHTQTFDCQIDQPINDYTRDEEIKLICVENKKSSNKKFSGVFSNIIFTGNTKYDANNPTVELVITSSSLPSNVTGSFVCSVVHDSMYRCNGGLVTVNVSNSNVDILDADKQWVMVDPDVDKYRLLPDEFLICVKG